MVYWAGRCGHRPLQRAESIAQRIKYREHTRCALFYALFGAGGDGTPPLQCTGKVGVGDDAHIVQKQIFCCAGLAPAAKNALCTLYSALIIPQQRRRRNVAAVLWFNCSPKHRNLRFRFVSWGYYTINLPSKRSFECAKLFAPLSRLTTRQYFRCNQNHFCILQMQKACLASDWKDFYLFNLILLYHKSGAFHGIIVHELRLSGLVPDEKLGHPV